MFGNVGVEMLSRVIRKAAFRRAKGQGRTSLGYEEFRVFIRDTNVGRLVYERLERFGWRATVSLEFFKSDLGKNSVRIQEKSSEFF